MTLPTLSTFKVMPFWNGIYQQKWQMLPSVAEERKERKIEKIRNRAPAPDRLVLLILRPRNRNEEPIA